MVIDLRLNPYRGVNAHLHSELQTPHAKVEGSQKDSWESFHSDQITFITKSLNQFLPAGYIACTEASIQVRVELPDILSPEVIRSPQPDISVWRTHIPEGIATATIQIEEPMRAVIIYNQKDNPITRIEVLSLANKPPQGSYRKQYLELRGGS